MVESILEEVASRPYIRYRADGSGMYSVDFSSACLLKDQVERLGSQLAILDANQECRVALQYCGWSLHDGVALASGEGEGEREPFLQGGASHCPACGRRLQVDGPGLYACPACATHFRVDGRGRTTPYESLGLSK